jgi:hypothetical protein
MSDSTTNAIDGQIENAGATTTLNSPAAETAAAAASTLSPAAPKRAAVILEGQRILEDLPVEEARDEKFLRLLLEPHYPLAVSAEFHYSEKGEELVVDMIKVPDPKGAVPWPATR